MWYMCPFHQRDRKLGLQCLINGQGSGHITYDGDCDFLEFEFVISHSAALDETLIFLPFCLEYIIR